MVHKITAQARSFFLLNNREGLIFFLILTSVLTGFVIFATLSFLKIPERITIPITVLVSFLVFSIAMYYSTPERALHERIEREEGLNIEKKHGRRSSIGVILMPFFFKWSFPIIYLISILIILSLMVSNPTQSVFMSWDRLSSFSLATLTSSILLSFFLPGYAIISIVDKNKILDKLPRFLLGYVVSILVTGFTSLALSYGLQMSLYDLNYMFLVIYSIVLLLYIVLNILHKPNSTSQTLSLSIESLVKCKFWLYATFSCLVGFVCISSYYLYNGTLIGDQLMHHARSLMFLTGSYQYLQSNSIVFPYLPMIHSQLSGFFSISGISSANSYASIAFLNIVPVVAFYYFFSRWFSFSKKASLLAATLFMLSSGFGWAYAIVGFMNSPPINLESAFELIDLSGRTTFDLRIPNSFLNNGTISTPLILIALPCGFILLGLLKEKWKSAKMVFLIGFLVSLLGIVSHEEFGLFIISMCVILLFFRQEKSTFFYASVLISLAVPVFLDTILFKDTFIVRDIMGIPYHVVLFVITSLTWTCYQFNLLHRARCLLKSHFHYSPLSKRLEDKRVRFLISCIFVGVTAYLYLFSFVTWSQIPVSDIHAQVTEQGQRIVPWYLYPMRFGAVGVLAVAFLLSYFFKQFEKETFIFVIVAVVAFVSVPFHIEFRLQEYMMASAAGLASLLLFKILTYGNNAKRIVRNGLILSLVVVSSGMSLFVYQGYIEMSLQAPEIWMLLSQRTLPDQINALNYINKNIDLKTDNVAIPNEFVHHFRHHYPGSVLAEQVEGYVGIPFENSLQLGASVLQTSSIEGFLHRLSESNIKFILLPKEHLERKDQINPVTEFALDYFPIAFEDSESIVLRIPNIMPPTANASTALVIPSEGFESTNAPALLKFTSLEESNRLDYFNETIFPTIRRNAAANYSEFVALNGLSFDPKSEWSNLLTNSNITYVEANLLVSESEGPDNHAGVLFNNGHMWYNVLVRPHSVSVYNPVDKEFLSNKNFIRQNDTWHNLRIVSSNGNYSVYADNRLMLTFPTMGYDQIRYVGISSINSLAFFSSLIVGQSQGFTERDVTAEPDQNYYFPLSVLSLSGIEYDTLFDRDIEINDKNNLVLGSDQALTKQYLEYVSRGNRIFLLDSDENSTREGIGKFIESARIGGSSDTREKQDNYEYTIISNDPFAMRYKIGNGELIYIDTHAYIDQTLGDSFRKVVNLISSISNKSNSNQFQNFNEFQNPPLSKELPIRVVGPLSIDGDLLIKSHSIYFPATQDLKFGQLTLKNNSNILSSISNSSGIFNNLLTTGPYYLSIRANTVEILPELSTNSYIPISVNANANLTISLMNRTSALQFEYDQNDRALNSGPKKMFFRGLANGTEVQFESIKHNSDPLTNESVLVLMKNPAISGRGNLSINEVYARDPSNPSTWLLNGQGLKSEGQIKLNPYTIETFSAIDGSYQNVIFIDSMYINQPDLPQQQPSTTFALPGDISTYAKENEITIPLEKAVFSEANLKVFVTFVIVGLVVIYFSWSKISTRIRSMS